MTWYLIVLLVIAVWSALGVVAVAALVRLQVRAEPGDMCDTNDPCTSCVSPQLCAETGDCWAHVFHFAIDPKDTDR